MQEAGTRKFRARELPVRLEHMSSARFASSNLQCTRLLPGSAAEPKAQAVVYSPPITIILGLIRR